MKSNEVELTIKNSKTQPQINAVTNQEYPTFQPAKTTPRVQEQQQQ